MMSLLIFIFITERWSVVLMLRRCISRRSICLCCGNYSAETTEGSTQLQQQQPGFFEGWFMWCYLFSLICLSVIAPDLFLVGNYIFVLFFLHICVFVCLSPSMQDNFWSPLSSGSAKCSIDISPWDSVITQLTIARDDVKARERFSG